MAEGEDRGVSRYVTSDNGTRRKEAKRVLEEKNSLDNNIVIEGFLEQSNSEELIIEPPENAWAWAVAVGCWVIHTLLTVPVSIFGILYAEILMSQNVSAATTVSIFGLMTFNWNFSAVYAGSLCAIFGWRKVVFVGSFLCGSSIILSGMATAAWQLFLLYSTLYGIGLGISIYTCHFLIPYYFKKRRGLVLGLTITSISTSYVLSPILITWLRHTIGPRWSLFILGALMLNGCVAAMFFQPVELHVNSRQMRTILLRRRQSSKADAKSAFKSLFKDIWTSILLVKSHRLKILAGGYALIMAVYGNGLMMLPFILKERGYGLDESSLLLYRAAVVQLVVRVSASLLLDHIKFSKRYIFMLGALCASLGLLGIALSETWIVMASSFTAFYSGCGLCILLISLLCLELMGTILLPRTLGTVALFVSITVGISGPIFGLIRDATENYTMVLLLLSACSLTAFCIHLLMPCAVKSDQKRDSVVY